MVPQKYITDNEVKLGLWLNTQRRLMKNRNLNDNKRVRLENLGVVVDESTERGPYRE